MSRAFTPRRIAGLEPTIREWTDAMLHREPGEVDPMPRIGPIIGQLAGTFMRYVSERRARPADGYAVRVPAGSVILLLTGSAGRWHVDWSGALRVTTSTVRGFARLPIHF